MSTNSINGLTSIIVPCWNQLEFTRQCLAALKIHTRPPWELIAINNGSTDETISYLAGARDLSAVPVTVVSNSVNLGFPAAINQGLKLARGEYLVLLNNDVVVTDGWLDQLLALARSTDVGEDHDGQNGIPPANGKTHPINPPPPGGDRTTDEDMLQELASQPNILIIDAGDSNAEEKAAAEARDCVSPRKMGARLFMKGKSQTQRGCDSQASSEGAGGCRTLRYTQRLIG